MSKEIYDKKDIYDELNKQVYFRDGGSVNLASLASSVEKIRSNSKGGNNSDSSDFTDVAKRFETEWVKGEDEVNISNGQANVTLGEFIPDFDRLVVNGEPRYKVGDVIDVPYKEVDITNLMFNNDGSAEQNAIPTRIHYKLPDGENYAAGDWLRCIRYERIAELPNDPNIKFSSLFIYTNGFFYSMGANSPERPHYLIETSWEEAEEDEDTGESYPEGFWTTVQFTDELNEDTGSDPREGYITFKGVEAEGDIYAIEGCYPDNAFIPKSQGDGYTSILDYYRFYFFANGKTYVVSRDGDHLIPTSISKNVIENLKDITNKYVGPILLNPQYDYISKYSGYMTRAKAAELLLCSERDLEALLDYRYTCVMHRPSPSQTATYFKHIVPRISYTSIHSFEVSTNDITLYFTEDTSSSSRYLRIERDPSNGWLIEYQAPND